MMETSRELKSGDPAMTVAPTHTFDPRTSPRLEVLRTSLVRKEAEFERRLDLHMADVKSANGQPLNDKRNGVSTMRRWDRQSDGLRTLKIGIQKTKSAIEREQSKIDTVADFGIPQPLKALVDAGTLIQWRKHPRFFFVKGVKFGRIVWHPDARVISHHQLDRVVKDERPLFVSAFNTANAAVRLLHDAAGWRPA